MGLGAFQSVLARLFIDSALRGNQSDVEAFAATTAERPGTVTSEPEPSTSDPSSTRSDAELFERHTGLKLKITDATRSDVTVEEYERSIIAWADDEDIELTDRQVRALVGALLETHQIRRK